MRESHTNASVTVFDLQTKAAVDLLLCENMMESKERADQTEWQTKASVISDLYESLDAVPPAGNKAEDVDRLRGGGGGGWGGERRRQRQR